MSILTAVQGWLSQYPDMQLQPLTDNTTGKPSSYAIAPSGNGKTAKDVTGARIYQNNYVFWAKECIQDEADRKQNYDFLESLTEWIEMRSDNGDLPELPGDYEAEAVGASNAMVMDVDDDGLGLYQVQLQITLTKRSN